MEEDCTSTVTRTPSMSPHTGFDRMESLENRSPAVRPAGEQNKKQRSVVARIDAHVEFPDFSSMKRTLAGTCARGGDRVEQQGNFTHS